MCIKKTIFDINTKEKTQLKLNNNETNLMDSIFKFNSICNQFIIYILNKQHYVLDNDDLINYIIKNIHKILVNTLLKLIDENNISIYIHFQKLLFIHNINIEKILSIFEIFIKKIYKKKINIKKVNAKMYHENCCIFINKYTPLKFVNWLFK